ncbi:hypothetical protein [Montanilutibacter psychrotolerans]|uniref:Uncharacterized protein n=1 Tax=Montanilutibacter psychrotolerans TaxID=1327343 RepID=A0A3M8SZ11_9GAMM|nr:hypothetical protein [Lysobacter psychrotolerans]RNF86063.1 hypothetical protein EER27_01105 [Lysobacter psychrotolerans]
MFATPITQCAVTVFANGAARALKSAFRVRCVADPERLAVPEPAFANGQAKPPARRFADA